MEEKGVIEETKGATHPVDAAYIVSTGTQQQYNKVWENSVVLEVDYDNRVAWLVIHVKLANTDIGRKENIPLQSGDKLNWYKPMYSMMRDMIATG